MTPKEPEAFGLFDLRLVPQLNRILKPHDLRLKVQRNREAWADCVRVTVEKLPR